MRNVPSMRTQCRGTLIRIVTLIASCTNGVAQDFIFSDDFEGPALNSFWSPSLLGSASITFPSTAQAHSGIQSLQCNTPGPPDPNSAAGLFHSFDAPVYGDVSVWVYDPMTAMDLDLWIRNRASGAFVRLFAQEGTGGSYLAQFPSAVFVVSPLSRSLGWHNFSISSLSSSLTLSVDGVTFYSGSGMPFDYFKLESYNEGTPSSLLSYWDDAFVAVTAVPEPSTVALLFIGMTAIVGGFKLRCAARHVVCEGAQPSGCRQRRDRVSVGNPTPLARRA